MAYIPRLDKPLVYSGMLEEGGVLPPETWYYDYNTNTWTKSVYHSNRLNR